MAKQPNSRLHECEDCHTRRYVAVIELNRAAKPRCYRCGSTKLEMIGEEAKEQRLNQSLATGIRSHAGHYTSRPGRRRRG